MKWQRQLQGKSRPDKEILMEVLSEEYGWLPSEIENEKAENIDNYLTIINIKRSLEKHKLKKNGIK